MADKKVLKNNDEYRALKFDELEVVGGGEDLGMKDAGACPECGSHSKTKTGNTRDYGPFGWFTAYEFRCDDCGKTFWDA